ncbi:MAG: septum formation initiator family protein [Clostridia bacterium]|nr:septum formation initiator family protein [Clostridia bacterium]
MKDVTPARGSSLLVKVLAVFFFAVAVFSIFRMQLRKNELLAEKERLEEQYRKNELTIAALKKDLEAEMDDEQIKKIAREKLNLCMPDEIIFYNDLTE